MRDFKVFVDDKGLDVIEHLSDIGYSESDIMDASFSFLFAVDGKITPSNLNIDFQDSELPRLTADEVLRFKREPFKPFAKVLVRDADNCKWELTMFNRMEGELYKCIGLHAWNQCIFYEGNEYLHRTNKNPE